MSSSRLSFARETGALDLPDVANAVLLEPASDVDVSGLQAETVTIQHAFKPTYEALAAAGWEMTTSAKGPVDLVYVTLPRARDFARGLIAQAEALAPDGIVIVDGAKSDGADAMLKAVRARVDLLGQVSKAHGKLFWFKSQNAFADWALPDPSEVSGGWITQPGIFSSDGPDPGSQALVAALPESLKGHGADLGGGWGYLTRHVLDRPGVTHVDLVEADKRALECAELNLSDDRVTFHWADATTWGTPKSLDWVVTNPPFHTSRTPDAALGQAFIQSAARLLKPHGRLLLVANRHLPYETTLAASFANVQELQGDSRYKILQADKPKAPSRAGRTKRR